MKKTGIFVFIMMFIFGFIVVAPAIARADPPPSTPDCAEQVWAQVQYYEPIINDMADIIQAKETRIEELWVIINQQDEDYREQITVLKEKNKYLRERRDYWHDRYLDLRDK